MLEVWPDKVAPNPQFMLAGASVGKAEPTIPEILARFV